jgi:diguanylate cyclase (GGDEF)-like protein/PAS domain S-box-containing protein
MPVYQYSIYAIPPAVTAAVVMIFAVVVALTRFSRTTMAMFTVSVAAAAWQATRVFMYLAVDERTAVRWARVGFACAILLAPAVYQFVDTMLENATHRRVVSVLAWLLAAQFAVTALTTRYFISEVHRYPWGFYPTYNIAARVMYPLFCGGLFIAAIVDIVRAYPASRGVERDRIRLFTIAIGVACIAAIDFLPAYGLPVYPLGWAAFLASAAIVLYALRKYGLEIAPALPATEIISTMRDLLLVSDRDGVIRFANNAACQFLGYTREDIIGQHLEDLLIPSDRSDKAPLQGWMRDREYVFRTKMGQPIELTLSHSPVTRQGEVTGAVIIGRDLRERKRYEWEARRAVTLLESTLESTADGILVIAHDGRVLTWNQRFADMWGIPVESLEQDDDNELIGQLVDRLIDPADFLNNLAELHEHPEDESVHMLLLRDGRRLEQYSIGRYLDDEPVRVWSFRDITERKRAEEQIEFQAYHDALTQLPNRRLFVERLDLHLASARRARSSVAVLFIDLDRFKTINDTLGHNVADALLVEIAQRLKSCVRQTDTVARYGGDEFTIILPDLHEPEDAAQVAEKILERVVEPVIVGTTSIDISVSIGIAVHPYDGSDIDTLLRNADDAMYRAKQAGRNNYQLCTEQMKTRAMERSSMQSRLRKAMDDDALVLAYEPQLSLSTGTIVGAEAIIRWNDPEHGLIEARDFIPAAEETRLIVPLGEWALFSACRQLREWCDAGLQPLRMAVNVSARQFQQRDLAAVVRRAADDAGIDIAMLELEIRETTAMRDIDLTVELLKALRDTGVSIAIDDFGSSYSSLGSLRVLPINAVKMDRSLVASVMTVEADASIVSAVIGVSRRLQLRVTADGVETREQFDFLKGHGCQEAQGAYFSAAVDPLSFMALTLGVTQKVLPIVT